MHISTVKKIFLNRKEGYLNNHTHFAVLVPLLEVNNQLHLLLQIRSSNLKSQPGEIAFPGGRVELNETWQQAALREASEELGILTKQIDWLGELDIATISEHRTVHAGIAFIQARLSEMQPCQIEVDKLFTVPLSFFTDTIPHNYQVEVKCHPSDNFPYEKIPNGRNYSWNRGYFDVPFYYYGEHIIWGLTARIITNLISLLNQ